jgi:cytochrome b561
MDRPADRYNAVAMLLHWVIAILLLYNIWLAWQMEDLKGPARAALMGIHKPVGITILLLSLVRLGWRLVNPPPPFSAHLKPWERMLAHVTHWSLYVVMIGMPLAGWAMVSAVKTIRPINMFGLFNWPGLTFLRDMPPDQRRDLHELLEFLHADAFKILAYILIVLHVAGALKHQFIDRDGELGRMIPFLRSPRQKDGREAGPA